MFIGVVGSSANGVNIPESDLDIAVLSDDRVFVKPKRYDICRMSYDVFISTLVGRGPTHWMTNLLFPKLYFKEFVLKDYFLQVNEYVIRAQLNRIYRDFSDLSKNFEYGSIRRTAGKEKRIAYSVLYSSILANYAEGMTFAQANRPEGELHDFLIGVRLGKVPLKEALARNKLERQRAEKAAGFYREDIHPEILTEFEQIIHEEAEKERR